MFKAVLADPKLLKSSIDAISNMIDEAGVSVDEKGIRLRAMDPAHVALVDFELKKEAFDKFEVKGSIVLGLDLDRFNTILKRAGASDKISLALDEDTNSLRIKFENTSTRTFNQPLIEVSEEELKVPNLDFPSTVELSPSIISEAIKDAEIISDHVTLKVDSGFLYVLAKGDLGNVEVKVAKGEAVQFEAEEEAQSMFSIEYLKDMVKASDVANSVRILIGDNLPVKMEFLAPSARLSFLLAP
ncbi:MAG: proliferating cell nuclear antigen (pcna), partial [Candidatus Hydrothermarchaeota archaeon]|nr:proliferating cell nuclear antigen (pcna) [Candidatus Hydrothermarchaeota archaeon]